MKCLLKVYVNAKKLKILRSKYGHWKRADLLNSSLIKRPKKNPKIFKKSYLTTLRIAFSAKLVDLQVRVGILPLIGLITSIV